MSEWQRLDAKMLLLNPVKVAWQFLFPALIALIGFSNSPMGVPPLLIPVLILGPIAFGVIPWFTTRFRLTESRFEMHSGLLNKKQLTAPLDRIRSVDLQSTLLHRVLGLSKVEIGTGVDETRIELDSLSAAQAEALRATLLARRSGAVAVPAAEGIEAETPYDVPPLAPVAPPVQVLATLDWSWLRFAPLSLSRLAVVAGFLGVMWQFVDQLPVLTEENVDRTTRWLAAFALPLIVAVGLAVGLLLWVVIAVTGYVLQWSGLRLVREAGHVRLTAGLLTTRSTTVEEAKIRGAELSEPVLLRLAQGAELASLATGVGEEGVTRLLPPCPRPVAESVGHLLLGDDGALEAPLVAHGRFARRRCHVRAQWSTLALTLAVVTVTVVLAWVDTPFQLPWWVSVLVAAVLAVLGVLTAEQEYAHLGHTLTRDHVVAGSGSWQRVRTALERDGVIGWVVSQSLFQRRVGLATLTATTAAGSERVVVRDLPLGRATALATAAVPGLLDEFLA